MTTATLLATRVAGAARVAFVVGVAGHLAAPPGGPVAVTCGHGAKGSAAVVALLVIVRRLTAVIVAGRPRTSHGHPSEPAAAAVRFFD